jgi:hypothetical protein
LGNPTALTVLDLGCNHLGELPDSLAGLTALTRLWLDDDRLDGPSHWLGNRQVSELSKRRAVTFRSELIAANA